MRFGKVDSGLGKYALRFGEVEECALCAPILKTFRPLVGFVGCYIIRIVWLPNFYGGGGGGKASELLKPLKWSTPR